MTRIVSLSESVIDNIINSNDSPTMAILEFIKYAIPEDWDKVKEVKTPPKVNKNTALLILDKLGAKFDKVKVNMLWLQYGFGVDNSISKDMIIYVSDGCYTLQTETTDAFMEMLAKRDIEEFISSKDDT